MELITRSAAKARGLTRYFTGKPCKHGHVADRGVGNHRCNECGRISSRKREFAEYQANPAAYLVAQRTQRRGLRGCLSARYSGMLQRVRGLSKNCAHLYKGLEIMPREEFFEWALRDPAYIRIHTEWVRAGYPMKLAPSIDRIDTQRGYVRGNVQWLTHTANIRKANLWRWHGINPITKAA